MDDPIVVCVDTAAQWQRFSEIIDHADLIADSHFAGGNARVHHHPALERELQAALSKRTRAEWLAAFSAGGKPAEPVNDIAAAAADPQIRARSTIRQLGERAFVKRPVRFSTYDETSRTAAAATRRAHRSRACGMRLFKRRDRRDAGGRRYLRSVEYALSENR